MGDATRCKGPSASGCLKNITSQRESSRGTRSKERGPWRGAFQLCSLGGIGYVGSTIEWALIASSLKYPSKSWYLEFGTGYPDGLGSRTSKVPLRSQRVRCNLKCEAKQESEGGRFVSFKPGVKQEYSTVSELTKDWK